MKSRLALSLLAAAAMAAPAFAETWKAVPDQPGAFYDSDFLRVDKDSGLVVARYAEGVPKGPAYKDWAKKDPIMVYAIDCMSDAWIDLGLDFDGKAPLPANWRLGERIPAISLGVGPLGKLACDTKDALPTVALP